MLLKLLLLMTIVPAVELWLLLELGARVGAVATVWIIVLTGIVGASLAKREGLAVVAKIKDEARNGLPPGERLVEGLLVLIGGILLLTPGVVTDLTGLLMIIPLSRRPLAIWAKRYLSAKLVISGVNVGSAAPGPAAERVRETLNSGSADSDEADSDGGLFDHPVL